MIFKLGLKLTFITIAAIVVVSCTGCSGGGVGDTVPSPPRSLVQQSLKQHGASVAQSGPSNKPAPNTP